jgi:hypothetical protein
MIYPLKQFFLAFNPQNGVFMTFKPQKSFKTLLLSAGILGASLVTVSSLPTAVFAQDPGEPLPEEVQPSPEETEPAPAEVTPGTSPESDPSAPTEVTPETSGTSVEPPEPGSFACENNPNPACENPERNVSADWGSENNPGPEYSEPPRLEGPLEPGSWACANNQNVVSCENPIRYTVEDPETWSERFPPAGERTSGSTTSSGT